MFLPSPGVFDPQIPNPKKKCKTIARRGKERERERERERQQYAREKREANHCRTSITRTLIKTPGNIIKHPRKYYQIPGTTPQAEEPWVPEKPIKKLAGVSFAQAGWVGMICTHAGADNHLQQNLTKHKRTQPGHLKHARNKPGNP
jgi:hypothetical protein